MTTGLEKINCLMNTLNGVILGKAEIIKQLTMALLANGHTIIEDVPGVGKTTLVKALARALGCEFRRIQCTHDLLPADITGITVYHNRTGNWTFQEGPVFSQILLVDEINRASPKTQSALLEAMQEMQVTVDGRTYSLPEPFLVIATQNPQEYEGIFPLPESQLDRFTMRITLGYPARRDEINLLQKKRPERIPEEIEPILKVEEMIQIQEEVEKVHTAESLLNYATALSNATRKHRQVILGISPRGTLHLLNCARACAYLGGRDYVIPDDIQEVFFLVFGHRLVVDRTTFLEDIDEKSILQEVLETVPVPGNTGK